MTDISKIGMNRIEGLNDGFDNCLNKQQITNCITEIPQDIKLELNNGVLTLKAGSKVYIPNGFESDGVTPKFDVVIIENDLIAPQRNYDLTNVMFIDNNVLTPRRNDFISSGSTPPSSPSNGWNWYDTTNNIIKYYEESTWTTDKSISFPLAIVKSTVSSSYTSIDRVFNGFGYIGSTIFALPNVKGLIPNGMNDDGTLKNIEYTSDKLSLRTFTDGFTNSYYLYYKLDTKIFSVSSTSVYNKETNFSRYGTEIGTLRLDSDVISNFQTKQPFRAVDYTEAISINIPNYNNAESISMPYTATKPGMLHINWNTTQAGKCQVEYIVNNKIYIRDSGYGTTYLKTMRIPLDIGDTVTESLTSATVTERQFIPFKGI